MYRQAPLRYLGAPFRYRITLEPHGATGGTRWTVPERLAGARGGVHLGLHAGDAPPGAPGRGCRLASHLEVRATEPLSPLQRRLALQLPPGRNPRSLALGRELRAGERRRGRIRRGPVLERFRSGGFAYTLTPPKLDLDSVDDFMFNTRRGFCGQLRVGVRIAGARWRRAGARGDGLPGRRMEPDRRLLHRAPVRRACLGRGMARGARLDGAHQPPPAAWSHRSASIAAWWRRSRTRSRPPTACCAKSAGSPTPDSAGTPSTLGGRTA